MAIKFREDPIGGVLDIDPKSDGLKILRQKPAPGAVSKEVSKVAFSAEPVRKFAGKGHWFELRCDDFSLGNTVIIGLGFTTTDPESLKDMDLPAKAFNIPKTWMIGYTRSCWWDGERQEIDPPFDKLKPFNSFPVGVLATPDGSLELYVRRKKVASIDPTEYGFTPIPTDEPLFAVIDFVGAVRKASLLPSSLPPADDEAEPGQEVG